MNRFKTGDKVRMVHGADYSAWYRRFIETVVDGGLVGEVKRMEGYSDNSIIVLWPIYGTSDIREDFLVLAHGACPMEAA